MFVVKMAGGAIAFVLMLAMTTVLARDVVPFQPGQSYRLSAISELKVKGGGNVTLRSSTDQSWSVTVVQGAEQVVMYEDGGVLQMECRRPCRANNRRVIEVSVPSLETITIENGGVVQVASQFTRQNSLTASITGGGFIDAFSMPADNVTASVRGGGTINITASRVLNATVIADGEIVYAGNPQRVVPNRTGRGQIRPR